MQGRGMKRFPLTSLSGNSTEWNAPGRDPGMMPSQGGYGCSAQLTSGFCPVTAVSPPA